MEDKPVIHVVGTECSPEDEEKFNSWYDEVHIPLLFRFKGIKEVTRYRITKGVKELSPFRVKDDDRREQYEAEKYPSYLAIYTFESRKAYEAYLSSPELAAAWDDVKKTWQGGGFKITWRMQYESMKTWRR